MPWGYLLTGTKALGPDRLTSGAKRWGIHVLQHPPEVGHTYGGSRLRKYPSAAFWGHPWHSYGPSGGQVRCPTTARLDASAPPSTRPVALASGSPSNAASKDGTSTRVYGTAWFTIPPPWRGGTLSARTRTSDAGRRVPGGNLKSTLANFLPRRHEKFPVGNGARREPEAPSPASFHLVFFIRGSSNRCTLLRHNRLGHISMPQVENF